MIFDVSRAPGGEYVPTLAIEKRGSIVVTPESC